MVAIELTEAQRRMLQAGRREPVEVVDPATQQRYVLLAREQYEQVRPLLEGGPPPAPTAEAAPAGPSAPEVPPRRIRLRDLPTPPEVVEEVKKWCRKYGWRRQDVENDLKLQYYFGGQAVYILHLPEGPVVIPIEDRFRDTPDLRSILLAPEERTLAVLDYPSPWHDTVSQIFSPCHYES
jgi:hypothetical protein